MFLLLQMIPRWILMHTHDIKALLYIFNKRLLSFTNRFLSIHIDRSLEQNGERSNVQLLDNWSCRGAIIGQEFEQQKVYALPIQYCKPWNIRDGHIFRKIQGGGGGIQGGMLKKGFALIK